MKKLLFFFIFTALSALLMAQSVPMVFKDWATNQGTQTYFYKNSMKSDASGNSYVVGATLNDSGNYDILVTKISSKGVVQWKKQYDGGYGDDIGTAVYIDANGNVFVTGTTTSASSVDIITIRYNSAGTQKWLNTYNGPDGTGDAALDLTGDANGRTYVTGYVTDTNSLSNLITICYNYTGTFQWATQYNYTANLNDAGVRIAVNGGTATATGCSQTGTSTFKYCSVNFNTTTGAITSSSVGSTNNNVGINQVNDMVQDYSGNIYIAGYVSAGTQHNNFDIVKLNSSLNVDWERTYNSPDSLDDVANAIEVDSLGNVYVTGYSTSATQGKNIKLLKYNSSGTLQWEVTYNDTLNGEDEAKGISLDVTNSNVYITGYTSTEIDNANYITIKYNTSGSEIWKIESDGEAHLNDRAFNISVNNTGIVVSGQSEISTGTYEYLTIKYVEKQIIVPTDYNSEEPQNNFAYYENRGQLINTIDSLVPELRYYTNNSSPAFYFKEYGHSFVFAKSDTSSATNDTLQRIDVDYDKCNTDARIYSLDEQTSYLNYFLPQCPRGITEVRGNSRLVTTDLYSNIDLIYSSNQNGIKYYYIIKPGGNPNNIAIKFTGATSITIDSASNQLTINSLIGSISYERPTVYQLNSSNQIIQITGWTPDWKYNSTYDYYYFNTGSYDNTKALVIQVDGGHSTIQQSSPDANLEWSTYFGGSGEDVIVDVANDNSNNLWVGGYATNPGYPSSTGTSIYNNVYSVNGVNCFVAKFNDIVEPQWISYFGGSGEDYITEIALDNNSIIYAVGNTKSSDFTNWTPNGINYSTLQGSQDGFFIGLNNNGNVICDSYIGGFGSDNVEGIAINGTSIALVGQTDNTSSFPLQNDANSSNEYYQSTLKGSNDAFIMRLDNSLNNIWCSLYGGSGIEDFTDVEFSSTSVIASGITSSSDPASTHPNNPVCAPQSDGTFPNCVCNLSPNSYNQTVYGLGDNDAMIVEFNSSNNSLIWSTYFGGSDKENSGWGYSNSNRNTPRICILGGREIIITGTTWTTGSGFPIYTNNINYYYQDAQHSPNNNNVYLARFDIDRVRNWCTFFGGNGNRHYVNDICSSPNSNSFFITGHANPTLLASSSYYCVVPQNQNEFPLCNASNQNYMEIDGGGPFLRTFIASFNTNTNSLIWSTRFGLSSTLSTNNAISASANKLFIGGWAWYADLNNKYKLWEFDDTPGSNDYYQYDPFNTSPHGVISRFNINNILLSVKENTDDFKNNILIKPNPATEMIEIVLKDESSNIAEIRIIDNLGRLIKKFHLANSEISYRVDLSGMNAGLYFIQVENNKGLFVTGKFIKQ